MDRLEEQEFDEWTSILLGGTSYDLNVWPDEHGNLRVAIYPLEKVRAGKHRLPSNDTHWQTNTLRPVATGKLDILDLKRIKEGL